MGKITAFLHLTLDGFFAGPNGEIDWFKSDQRDADFDAHMHQQARGGSTLIFGRTTYEMMKSYWPTPEAIEADPEMAKVLNQSPKLVFSRTLSRVEEGPNWKNIELIHDIDPADVSKRKEKAGSDFTILGSGSVVQQFTNLGLLDVFGLVIVPIILGTGKRLFQNVRETNLDLLESRSFKSGLTFLRYGRKKSRS
jgi:dihydrofolate reductase